VAVLRSAGSWGVTAYAGGEVRQLRGDECFYIFGRARRDPLFQGTLGLIVRPLTIGGFAPVVRVARPQSKSD
jgi:hypothetical protein